MRFSGVRPNLLLQGVLCYLRPKAFAAGVLGHKGGKWLAPEPLVGKILAFSTEGSHHA
jgi:hypothetical protein